MSAVIDCTTHCAIAAAAAPSAATTATPMGPMGYSRRYFRCILTNTLSRNSSSPPELARNRAAKSILSRFYFIDMCQTDAMITLCVGTCLSFIIPLELFKRNSTLFPLYVYHNNTLNVELVFLYYYSTPFNFNTIGWLVVLVVVVVGGIDYTETSSSVAHTSSSTEPEPYTHSHTHSRKTPWLAGCV